jgi:hypothetical protein
VLVESPIDAMSIALLDRTESRKTIYLSTDGTGSVPMEFLRQLPFKLVIVAYDNDQPGDLIAQGVMKQYLMQYADYQKLSTGTRRSGICLIWSHSNSSRNLNANRAGNIAFRTRAKLVSPQSRLAK